MDSGTFGSNEYYLERLKRRKMKLVSRLMKESWVWRPTPGKGGRIC
jgi:hypothetical protein